MAKTFIDDAVSTSEAKERGKMNAALKNKTPGESYNVAPTPTPTLATLFDRTNPLVRRVRVNITVPIVLLDDLRNYVKEINIAQSAVVSLMIAEQLKANYKSIFVDEVEKQGLDLKMVIYNVIFRNQ